MAGVIDKQKLSARLLKRRIILVDGDLNEELCEFVRLALWQLNAESAKPIYLHIHSIGGVAARGLLLYELIAASPAPVTAIIWIAASAALIVAQACKRRLAVRSGRVLVHCTRVKPKDDLVYDEYWEERHQLLGSFLRDIKKRKLQIFHKHSGLPKQRIKKLMKQGELKGSISVQRAKKLRLIDDIVPNSYQLFAANNRGKKSK